MLQYYVGCNNQVTPLFFYIYYDILSSMKDVTISCNYCNTPTKLKRDKIYMQCHCDDDRRIIDINEYLLDDKHHDYLYSMFSDEYVYVNEK